VKGYLPKAKDEENEIRAALITILKDQLKAKNELLDKQQKEQR
jgi:hypothetical protein